MTAAKPSSAAGQAEQDRSPDPLDERDTVQSHDTGFKRHEGEREDENRKPQRYSREEIEENVPADPDPDDPVSG